MVIYDSYIREDINYDRRTIIRLATNIRSFFPQNWRAEKFLGKWHNNLSATLEG